ncbi:hypothetical protein [Leucobacter sp. GX24907]
MINANRIHTPYHDLNGSTRGSTPTDASVGASITAPRVPAWVQHRAVYRTGGRTVYVVETDRVHAARPDLEHLERAGWDVHIDRVPASTHARITLTQRELAKAA